MFGTDRGVIEPSRHRVSQFDLTFLIGEEKCFRSLQHTESAALKTRGVFTAANSFAAAFDADHSHILILKEWVKETDCVAAAAHAGDQQIRQSFFALENLAARLNANDALEVAHHHRVRVRAED